MTRGDRLIGLAIIVVALLAAPQAGALLAPHAGDIIVRGPAGTTVIDPSRDGVYIVQGRTGQVEFQSRDGEVRAIRADCPDHLCVRSGSVAPGRPVICAPNGVSATLVPRKGVALDAVSR
ncbi:MAG: NusG domain II-containing protein [Coriobacteriia bacterium]|nr:NusG domain II-containing protein [Coriobacteriia bacterium]